MLPTMITWFSFDSSDSDSNSVALMTPLTTQTQTPGVASQNQRHNRKPVKMGKLILKVKTYSEAASRNVIFTGKKVYCVRKTRTAPA